MNTLRYCTLLLLCAFSPLLYAGDNSISITNHIWEIHMQNGDTIRLPYHRLEQLKFSKKDLKGNEYEDYVSQTLTRNRDRELTDMLDSIAFMRYVRETSEIINPYDGNVYSSQGFYAEFSLPKGSVVTHQESWLELDDSEDGKVKVQATTNNSVFWRRDTINIALPNGSTTSYLIEQPGDKVFNAIGFGATISADIENSDDGGITTSITWGSACGGNSGGTQTCNLVGKKGDRKHTYTVTINQHTEDSTPTADGEIWGYYDWILNISVTVDVSFYPGKVESATIFDYRHRKSYWDRYYTTTFQASFGEMEGANNGYFWTNELPSSFSWDLHNEITGDPPYHHTEKILNVLGGSCSMEFHCY